jgi:hypothetical protein
LVGAALSLGFFYGCKKDSFTDSTHNSITELKNPITAEKAEEWFQGKFGMTKLIDSNGSKTSSSTTSASLGESSEGFHFKESFQITPLWTQAQITAYLQTNPILVVPVKPIAFLDKRNQLYGLVVFRDSFNQLDARLQVYSATPNYEANHETFSVHDFSGFLFQIDLNGKVDNIYGLDNGKFITKIKLKPNASQLTVRGLCDCFTDDPTAGFIKRAICWICDVFGGGGDEAVVQNVVDVFGFDRNDVLQYASNNDNNNNGGGGGSSGTGTNPPNLNSEIDNTLFDVVGQTTKFSYYQGLYMGKGFNDTEFEDLYMNPKLFTQVNKFFEGRGSSPANVNAIKQLVNNYSLDVEDRTRHLKLLNNDAEYYNKNQAAGMPPVGSAAWGNTLKFTITSPTNGLDIYDVTFPNYVKTKEAIFARAFAEDAAEHIDKIFDAALIHVNNIINPLDRTNVTKITNFANALYRTGGNYVGIFAQEKAAILSAFISVQDITASNPSGFINFFDDSNADKGKFESQQGIIGDFENKVDKIENYNASSFRSLNAIEIRGLASPSNPIMTKVVISLSLISVDAQ